LVIIYHTFQGAEKKYSGREFYVSGTKCSNDGKFYLTRKFVTYTDHLLLEYCKSKRLR